MLCASSRDDYAENTDALGLARHGDCEAKLLEIIFVYLFVLCVFEFGRGRRWRGTFVMFFACNKVWEIYANK